MIRLLVLAGVILLVGANAALCADGTARGEMPMDRIEKMKNNMRYLQGIPGADSLAATDPELAQIRDRLIYGEIAEMSLDAKQRELVTLVALTALQTRQALRLHVEAALNAGAAPMEVREALYQVAPYVGFPKVEEALAEIASIFKARGLQLPLANQGTVSEASRLADGLAVQKRIFGAEPIEKMRANAPAGQRELLANYLSAYCFGDFYTRQCLDLKMRELLTFSAIVALGGCDPQAKAHAGANISVGNSKQNLVDCLAVLLPYIGFPRTLNGLAAVNAAVPES